ncbi:hypothetical protein Ddye_019632 [Dipteronia dyeriana]|uniref:Uncharacterized protein n=1 Tax=Dipteronia dyeriana TaxID=168575 RepID=A0AAD9TYF9_9ROSI|nr:hypothetical protein Ddye_019632 [Dipteronia dyeriana]
MGSRGILLLKLAPPKHYILNENRINNISSSKLFTRHCTTSSLEPPDLSRLAETARISLNPSRVIHFLVLQVEEFTPKIRAYQVIDWYARNSLNPSRVSLIVGRRH